MDEPINIEALTQGGLIKKPQQQEPHVVGGPPPSLSLRGVLGRKRLPTKEALRLAGELCLLLQYCHDQGVIHRDLRPENIYIDDEGASYLGGFASAKILGADDPADTGGLVGVPGYAPPEQLQRSISHIEPRSDLFSFGVILYELLSGEQPFAATSRHAILLATLESEPTPLRHLLSDCPAELETLCQHLLAKPLEQRPSSAQRVYRELARCQALHSQEVSRTPGDPELSPANLPDVSSLAVSDSAHVDSLASPLAELELQTIEPTIYEIVNEVGRGGLGKVFRAKDKRLQRLVAVKELLKNEGYMKARFLREAFITAKLQHPGIVPIYEAGSWPSGEPFYSMKLVTGRPLDELMKSAKSLQERLSLLHHLIAVAEAIAYAHSQRIIHRDLKPQNILTGDFGETLVIDWGIAKELDGPGLPDKQGATDQAHPEEITLAGEVMGTPAYMPPEQAQGKAVDERADIYALGAILYALLAGQPAYSGSSRAIKSLLQGPPTPIEDLIPEAPRELGAITKKAMARASEDRYSSAKDFAEDLKRFQTGQSVRAHQYSLAERAFRFARRNQRVFITAGLSVLLLVALGVYSYVINVRARKEAEAARDQARVAEQKQHAIAMERTLQLARSALKTNPTEALQYAKTIASVYPEFERWGALRAIASEALALGVPRPLGGVSWAASPGHSDAPGTIAFSPDGRLLASGSYDKTVRLWDLATGRDQLLGQHDDVVWRVIFSPDSKLLASTAALDHKIWLWDVTTGKLARQLTGNTHNIYITLFSPDGKFLASSGFDHKVRVWDVATGVERWVFTGHTDEAFPLSWSQDAKLLASGGNDNTVRIWNLETGESRVFSDYKDRINNLGFFPQGDLLFTQSNAQEIKLWDVATGALRLSLTGLKAKLSPSGALIAAVQRTNNEEKTIAIWSTNNGKLLRTLDGPQGVINQLAFSNDGSLMAAASADHSVYVWDLTQGSRWILRGHSRAAIRVAFSPDDHTLASAGEDPSILLWDVEGLRGRALYEPEALSLALTGQEIPPTAQVYAEVASPDLTRIALAFSDGAVRLRELSTGQEHLLETHFDLGGDDIEGTFVFSPDGEQLAAIGEKKIRLWSLRSGQSRDIQSDIEPKVLAFSPDGETLASGGKDAQIRLFHAASGEQFAVLTGHQDHITALAFSPDGETLASTSQDYSARLWDLATGRYTSLSDEKKTRYWGVCFSPDGKTLAAIGNLAAIRLWDLSTPTHPMREFTTNGSLLEIQFSSDGLFLGAAGDDDGGLVLWELATGERQRFGHDQLFHKSWFSAQGDVLGVDDSLRLRQFTRLLPSSPKELLSWLKALPMPAASTPGE